MGGSGLGHAFEELYNRRGLAGNGYEPALSNLTTNSALLSGQVLTTGGDAPTVTLYYGPSNGSNNPAAWAHSANLGVQVARFAQSVSGLTPSTTYYFTAAATNGAGTAWARRSRVSRRRQPIQYPRRWFLC